MRRVANEIDYGNLMHRALRQLMSDVLTDVSQNGLPGNHHFFISFKTDHAGVDVPDWLVDQYPDEMTIVIQNWFDNLVVSDDQFEITLSFSNQPVHLVIPFDAVLTFVDPSVEFGLRFDTETEAASEVHEVVEDEAPETEESQDGGTDSDVVSLDAFRK